MSRTFTPEHRAKIAAALKGRSKSDAARAAMSRAKSGNKRQPHTDETKAKLRAAHLGKTLSPEHRAKLSAAKLGKPGPWLGLKRGPQNEEWRRRISKGNKGKAAAFPLRRFHYRGVPFRSSWERAVAIRFDALGIEWLFEPKRFDLGGNETYSPDFYLPQFDCYWEVKGYLGPKSKRTIAMFRERYPDIALVVATVSVICMLDATFNPRARPAD